MGHVARFTQVDLKRAVKGVEEGGLKVGLIKIDTNGAILIYPVGTAPKPAEGAGGSWDDVLP
jgi:hypothetical protein